MGISTSNGVYARNMYWLRFIQDREATGTLVHTYIFIFNQYTYTLKDSRMLSYVETILTAKALPAFFFSWDEVEGKAPFRGVLKSCLEYREVKGSLAEVCLLPQRIVFLAVLPFGAAGKTKPACFPW